MTRRLAAAALVLLLPIGMAACSSQSKANACAEIEKARNAVLEQSDSLDSATDADDFRSKMDLFVGIYKDAANNVSNKEVSAAYKDVLADLDKINEAMGAETFDYYSDEMLALTQDLTEHGDKLNELCGFSWDR